jgi:hypothetical protein
MKHGCSPASGGSSPWGEQWRPNSSPQGEVDRFSGPEGVNGASGAPLPLGDYCEIPGS